MYHITLSGFTGGHSGVEIGLGRGNAIRALAKLLIGFDEASLIDFKGGEAMNAIPRDAEAVITISSDKVEALSALVREFNKNSTANYPNDKALCMIQKLDTTTATKMFDAQSQKRFLTLLAKIPNGVISFESANPKLVRSSSNIGFVETKNNIVEIIILFRSSVERGLNDVESVIKDLFEVAGASVEIKAKFYPWEPQFDTDLLKFTVKTYKKIYQREPKVETIHAGLECAPFYQNMPGVQIVSFGPDMGDVHTPDEWVDVDSVERFWNFLLALIQSA
jgi:dipeptidase D